MLIPKSEGQKLFYNDIQKLPHHFEIINGNMLEVEDILEVALYHVGLKKMVEKLPPESKEELIRIIGGTT